jgi:CBS domain-containing protein
MAQKVSDVMTSDPVTLPREAPLVEAARLMRDQGIGDVIVIEGDSAEGIVTDRDIVVRGVADGRDPNTVQLGDVLSGDLTAVSPNDSVDRAVQLMRQKAIRRLPVVDGGRPVGIVSLGDLAMERDEGSVLADISEEPPNV